MLFVSQLRQSPLKVLLLVGVLGLSLVTLPAAAQIEFNDITPDLNPFGPGDEGQDQPPSPGEEGQAAEESTGPTAQEVYQNALKLMEEEKWGEAVELFNALLAQQPNAADALLQRGKCFAEMGEPQLALESLGQAVNVGQRIPALYAEALGARAEVLLEMGQYQDAVDDLGMAVQSNPSDPFLLFLRGRALIRMAQVPRFGDETSGLFAQAVGSLSRCISIDENYADAYAERSSAQATLGKYDKSVEDMEQAVELDQESTKFKALLGYAYSRRAENEKRKPKADMAEVAADYQRAINAFSEYIEIEGEKDKSEFEEIADPEFIMPAQVFLARAATEISLANESSGGQSGLYSAAIADSDRALDYEEQAVMAMYQKGVAQRLSGDLDGAIDTFSDALEVSPTFAEALLRRGIVYFYQGEYEAARGDFQAVLEFRERPDGRAEFWTGASYAKEGRYQDAIRMYSKTIRTNPFYKPAYNNRGLVHMALGEYQRAILDFDELLRRDHKDSVARQRRDRARQMVRN